MKQGRNDIKRALEKLQVNRPLKLPTDGPGLKAPQTQVADKEVPLYEAPRVQLPPTEHPRKGALSQDEPPRNENVPESQEEKGFQRPQNEHPHYEAAKPKQPRSEVTKKERPDLEVTQNEDAHEGDASAAFFRLSPRVFSEALTRNLSGDCFRLFLWMSWRAWRYPNSPGVVRAAVSFIEEETGLGHATASRALKKLKESSLIELVETDFKRGNLWKVSTLACPHRSPDPSTGAKPPRNEQPSKDKGGASERGASHLNSSTKAPRNEGHLKNYINLRNLSQEDAKILVGRAESFSAPRKREVELRNLDALLARYSPFEIRTALEHLEAKGTLRGEKCHSPFSYLAIAADEVMTRLKPKVELPVILNVEPRREPEPEVTLTAFESELHADAQEKFLSSFVEKEFPHGFLPPKRVIKALAAKAWSLQKGSTTANFQLAV